jgi:hypothetical protein
MSLCNNKPPTRWKSVPMEKIKQLPPFNYPKIEKIEDK